MFVCVFCVQPVNAHTKITHKMSKFSFWVRKRLGLCKLGTDLGNMGANTEHYLVTIKCMRERSG